MGTHPIFESDFDCLTDQNRITSVSPRSLDLVPPPNLAESVTSENQLAVLSPSSTKPKKMPSEPSTRVRSTSQSIFAQRRPVLSAVVSKHQENMKTSKQVKRESLY